MDTKKFIIKKAKKSEFVKNFKKSYDWSDVKVTVDANDHQAAEASVSPELMNYLNSSLNNDLTKIPFAKGTLTIAKTAEGLYSGFFQDSEGQVVDKYEPTTLPIIAKNMMVKNLYSAPVAVDVAPTHSEQEEAEDRAIARQEAIRVVNEMVPANPEKSIRIKYGNFELEIKKSINEFLKSFKTENEMKGDLRKAINSWRRNAAPNLRNDADAARELLDNWEDHKESFHQITFALEQMKKKHG